MLYLILLLRDSSTKSKNTLHKRIGSLKRLVMWLRPMFRGILDMDYIWLNYDRRWPNTRFSWATDMAQTGQSHSKISPSYWIGYVTNNWKLGGFGLDQPNLQKDTTCRPLWAILIVRRVTGYILSPTRRKRVRRDSLAGYRLDASQLAQMRVISLPQLYGCGANQKPWLISMINQYG